MKSVVVSYSFTGNNEALADRISEEFNLDHIKIKENKNRTNGTIAKDMLFKKTPQVEPSPEKIGNYDLILLHGPVWMGHVASPLRSYLKYLKTNPRDYAFISISGGADGPNPKLEGELIKTVGKEPVALIDMHIADLLPSDPKPTRKDTSSYHLNDGDINKLTITIIEKIREKIPDL